MPLVTLDQLNQFATDFAATLSGGEVILLEGELGAGKTTFVQAVCRTLGVEDKVTSPTFAIMNMYEVRSPAGSQVRKVVHLDLYRLKSARELAALGLEEYLGQSDTIVFIEWPNAVDAVSWNATHRVQFVVTTETERTIQIERVGGG